MNISKKNYDTLVRIFGNNDAEGIPREQIHTDCLVKEKDYDNVSALKRVITTNINAIISSCRGFKIGKTGDPGNRANAYRRYSRMYLLCKGRKSSIDILEAYYNSNDIDGAILRGELSAADVAPELQAVADKAVADALVALGVN